MLSADVSFPGKKLGKTDLELGEGEGGGGGGGHEDDDGGGGVLVGVDEQRLTENWLRKKKRVEEQGAGGPARPPASQRGPAPLRRFYSSAESTRSCFLDKSQISFLVLGLGSMTPLLDYFTEPVTLRGLRPAGHARPFWGGALWGKCNKI